jgi:Protease inhibitor Inh
MTHRPLSVVALCCAFGALAAALVSAAAQTQAPSDEAKEMQGTWEISNADRDKICTVTLAPEPARGGMKLAFDPACAEVFEVTKEVAAWRLDHDGLHFVDAKGRALIDLDEVEKGIFEGMRAGEGRYFVQSLAAVRPEAQPEQVFGEWQVSRGTDEPVCVLVLSDTPAAANFSLELKPGCGALVSGFGPTSWHMDHGELVISSAKGVWRFEEAGEVAWRRIPEGAEPLWLVRETDVPPPEGDGG